MPPTRRLQSDHERGRSHAVPAEGGVAKKTSRRAAGARATVKKSTAAAPRSPPPDYVLALPAPGAPSAARSVPIREGEYVGVRTHVGTLGPTGRRFVLWLGAVVVSAAGKDGHLEVKYSGNFPRDDPSRTVRVAMEDVRKRPAAAASTSATAAVNSAAPNPSSGKTAAQRPTVAGKSLPLLKKFFGL